MKHGILAIVIATLGGALAGCVTAVRDQSLIGTLEVYGANAYLRGLPVSSGARVYDGDTISTGEDTSMRLRLVDGGFIQLDENTDPQLLREAACIVIRILKGQTFVDAKRICISDPNLEVVLNSRANLETAGRRSTFTLLDGRAELRRPVRRALAPRTQLTVRDGVAERARPLSAGETEKVPGWMTRYISRGGARGGRGTPPEPAGWCCIDGKLSRGTPERCREARGRYYPNEEEARKSCVVAPPEPVGWCCIDGKLSRGTPERCREARGRFYADEDEARKSCVIIK